MKVEILLFALLLTYSRAKKCEYSETVNITDGTKDPKTNNIMYNGVSYTPELYDYFNYIIENFTEVKVDRHLRGCLCKIKPCVRICCKPNKMKDYEYGKCVDHVSENKITVNYTEDGQYFQDKELNKDYEFVYEKPCPVLQILEHLTEETEIWVFLKNTSITLINSDNENLGFNDFCLSNSISSNGTILGTFAYRCFSEAESTAIARFYIISILLSIPFLIITFLVHAFIPQLRNLHGKTLMSYVACLTLSFIFLVIINDTTLSQYLIGKSEYCKMVGYIFYASMLTSFFWLNVMSYDIWKTITGGVRDKRKSSEKERYWKYAKYAFGVPLLILIFTAFMDNYDGVPRMFKPKIGEDSCFLSMSAQTRFNWFLYMHFPMITLIVSNIIMYAITAHHIYKVEKQTKSLRSADSQVNTPQTLDKERFIVYLRLFIIMGITWLMDSISWIFSDLPYLFYLTDFLNSIQGVIIFFLFVWKPKVRALIAERWKKFRST